MNEIDSNIARVARNDRRRRDAGTLEARVHSLASSLGFAACGITDASDLACGPSLERWLAEGRHGDMEYLAEKHERRRSPTLVLPGARSVVVVAWAYPPAFAPAPDWKETLRGRVAAYAVGPDYHAHVAAKLESLASLLREVSGAEAVVHVDGGPLVEKELARRAGIGWYGRNTNILRPGAGSSFVLGAILSEAPLAADPPFLADHCGTCRACIPACPTGALDDGPTIDARLCISYLTIEHRGPLPMHLRAAVGGWVFGCDLCQAVCPWNGVDAVVHPLQNPWLPGWLAMGEEEFRSLTSGTALARPKRRGLARNAAVALGNSGNPAAVPFLAGAVRGHDEPLVRAHAAWALGVLGGREAAVALDAAAALERIPPVRREIEAATAELRRRPEA